MTVQSGSRVRIPVFPRNAKQFGRCTFVQRFCVQRSAVESSLSKAAALMRKKSRPGSSRIALLTDNQGRAERSEANPSFARFTQRTVQGRAERSEANPSFARFTQRTVQGRAERSEANPCPRTAFPAPGLPRALAASPDARDFYFINSSKRFRCFPLKMIWWFPIGFLRKYSERT